MKPYFSLTKSFTFKTSSIEELYQNAYDWLTERSPENNVIWTKDHNYIIEDAKQFEYINFRIINNTTGRISDYSRTASIKFNGDIFSVKMVIDIPKPRALDGLWTTYPFLLHDRMYDIFKGISGEVSSSDLGIIYPEEIINKYLSRQIVESVFLIGFFSISCLIGIYFQKQADSIVGVIIFFFGLILVLTSGLRGTYKIQRKYRAIRKIVNNQ